MIRSGHVPPVSCHGHEARVLMPLTQDRGLKIGRLDANLAVVETRDQFPPHLPIISYVLTIFCTFFSVRYPTIHGRTPPPSQTAGCTRPSLCVRLDSVRSMSRSVRYRPTCMDQRFSLFLGGSFTNVSFSQKPQYYICLHHSTVHHITPQ